MNNEKVTVRTDIDTTQRKIVATVIMDLDHYNELKSTAEGHFTRGAGMVLNANDGQELGKLTDLPEGSGAEMLLRLSYAAACEEFPVEVADGLHFDPDLAPEKGEAE